MVKSPRLSCLLGVATAWPPLYLFAFIALSAVLVLSQPVTTGGAGIPSAFIALFVLHLFTMALGLALMAVYLVDLFRNPDLVDRQDMRIMWVVLVVVLSGLAMPVYWWLYLRPGTDAFQRRQVAIQPTA